jgi:hypothetical protein
MRFLPDLQFFVITHPIKLAAGSRSTTSYRPRQNQADPRRRQTRHVVGSFGATSFQLAAGSLGWQLMLEAVGSLAWQRSDYLGAPTAKISVGEPPHTPRKSICVGADWRVHALPS